MLSETENEMVTKIFKMKRMSLFRAIGLMRPSVLGRV
jgi:hypothetical protein